MEKDKKYAFRDRLLQTNYPIERVNKDFSSEYLSLENGCFFTGDEGIVIDNAKKDFAEFLDIGFSIKENNNGLEIELKIDPDALREYKGYKGRIIKIEKNKIVIIGNEDRGISAGIFDLEILIKREKAPFVKIGEYSNKPLFSPRMAHSAYALDTFPDGYLLSLAKEGIDAIVLFVRGINKNMISRECDFNDIITRAKSYGLDAYAYCILQNLHHPEEENAEMYYDEVYGKFFEAHPGFKGIVFVGESTEFLSRDPHVGELGHGCFFGEGEDNIPTRKPAPGFWPCNDYPQWISLIAKVIRRQRADAEIILWTYNWGYAPEKDRVELIRNLPKDIIVQTTYETFQKIKIGKAVGEVMDYTISIPTCGEYFESEARAAKERGIKLYAMSNTAGKTWDFGVVPYLPVPYQYQKRYDQMIEFSTKYNLAGIMECHHYGTTPSFISRYEKYCFETGGDLTGNKDTSSYLVTVLKEFYEKDADKVSEALKYLSEGMNNYVPSDEVQYSALRIGTAYPLCLNFRMDPPEKQDGIYFGLRICNTLFKTVEYGRCSVFSVRDTGERPAFKRMLKLFEKGIAILDKIENPILETEKLINLVKFMRCNIVTLINSKEFYMNKCLLMAANCNAKVLKYAKAIKDIAEREILNAEESLEYLDKDSVLGFEPSMLYVGDRERVEWKIRQVRYMVDRELKEYFDSVTFKTKGLKIRR